MNKNDLIPTWIRELFACVDRQDSEKFLLFLNNDCRFVFAGRVVAQGKVEVSAFLAGFFSEIDDLKHNLHWAVESGDKVVVNGSVIYSLSGLNAEQEWDVVLTIRANKISNYSVYIDTKVLDDLKKRARKH